jgi:hypothetical protein
MIGVDDMAYVKARLAILSLFLKSIVPPIAKDVSMTLLRNEEETIQTI